MLPAATLDPPSLASCVVDVVVQAPGFRLTIRFVL